MCADDLGSSHIRIPARGDLHGISRQGRGCHGLAFITALDRCGLAGEETAFLVFQAVVVRGFVVTIFSIITPLPAFVVIVLLSMAAVVCLALMLLYDVRITCMSSTPSFYNPNFLKISSFCIQNLHISDPSSCSI